MTDSGSARAPGAGEPERSPDMGTWSRALAEIANSFGRYALVGAAVLLILLVVLLTEVVLEPGPLAVSPAEVSNLGGAADLLRSLLGISVITGIVAMAVVQAMKDIWSVRGWFQSNELREYLGDRAFEDLRRAMQERSFGDQFADRSPRGKLARSRKHLRYVLSLPLEQLTGQLAAAAELAIIDLHPPSRSPDAPLVTNPDPRFGNLLQSLAGADDAGVPVEDVDQVELLQRVQRSIDTLQIVIGHRWRWFLRVTSMLLCAPIVWVLLSFSDATLASRVVTTIAVTVVGGWFSWFARDVAAVVERWRR